jgi:hypothetical protein
MEIEFRAEGWGGEGQQFTEGVRLFAYYVIKNPKQ